ncbi:hypothetical protein [Paenibacillus alkalitolerans]|uniref:hypothetical protein n=1 Tax=Paenibacillus alkalitolerans TaxID=2799335 RepID=UPI0018F4854F|nr:hypothetical protein [Paenibacillus alkalitolerans]
MSLYDDKFKEIVQSKFTQEDVMTLFESSIEELISNCTTQVLSTIRTTAIMGENLYNKKFGDLFPVPLAEGELRKKVFRKIVELYNSSDDRLYNIVLQERDDITNG